MTLRARSPVTKIVPAPQKIEDLMGLTHVTVTIRNPADPTKSWDGLFLVDTGAFDCMAPATAMRSIGLTPFGKRKYELADGTEVEFDAGVAQAEYMGDTVGTTIIFGPDDAEPILGVTALESAGIIVDPQTQKLKRLPAVPLKTARQAKKNVSRKGAKAQRG